MNLEKVVFGFFVVLAATLNFGFFIGDLGNPELHNVYELFAAVVVNLIATVLKFGDRTQIGAVHLATSLVASLQLIAAAVVVDLRRERAHGRRPHGGADGHRGVALGWSAVRQRGLRRAAGGRDRLLPAPLRSGRSWRAPPLPELGPAPVVRRRLPGPAADAGAAHRPHRDLRGQRAGAVADTGAGRPGSTRPDGASSTRSTS